MLNSADIQFLLDSLEVYEHCAACANLKDELAAVKQSVMDTPDESIDLFAIMGLLARAKEKADEKKRNVEEQTSILKPKLQQMLNETTVEEMKNILLRNDKTEP